MATKAELEKRLKDLENVQKEFDDFKKRVVEVGGRYARENDYCSDYDEMMAELGLDSVLGPDQYKVKVAITFDLTAKWDNYNRDDKPQTLKEFERHVEIDEEYFNAVLGYKFGRERVTNFDIKITDFQTGAR